MAISGGVIAGLVLYLAFSLGVAIGTFDVHRRVQEDGRVVFQFGFVPGVLKRELWLRPLYVLAVFLPAILWPLLLAWVLLRGLSRIFCSCDETTTCCGWPVHQGKHGTSSGEVDVEAAVGTQNSPGLSPGSSEDEKNHHK